MPTLYHHPLCPHSRFVRLVLAEYGVNAELIEERAADRRPEFLALDPAGRTPVFIDDDGSVVPGVGVIAEYLDEVYGPARGVQRLLPQEKGPRIETRRLVDWFNVKFFDEVTGWLVKEKVYKRFSPQGGAPDMDVLRVARANIRHHMRYIGYLTSTRNWLAGDRLTYADFAAAAHISCADYLGDAPWDEDEAAKHWYQRIKSRPAFRPLLADRAPGMTPSPLYAELDF
ncbi:glutathione S-transferase family protein [Methylocystis sp. WRRC1]|uniref:glutathione S-transferase family protein n=1 Tax=Methylocystis sp. WRRC1 TaxID=1732014 RepID=UPI001D14D413|nr:glutathione S-transferase family protein [Methylocystis sp. WRRC1]MCC3246629.1 glutathione S-transferase family protein [Methylocystis sp. WRRC1]